jgi:hypothetical protein
LDQDRLQALLDELLAAAEAAQCRSCRCLHDTIRQVRDDLAARGVTELESIRALGETIARLEPLLGHDCAGCDPCLPAAQSRALNELFGELPPKAAREPPDAEPVADSSVPGPVRLL